jgi:hypothetical protein
VTDSRLSFEGRTLRMARTGILVSVGPRLGEGAQGVVREAAFGGFPCVVKWYRSVPRPVELRPVPCWNCGNVPPRPPVLKLPAGRVVLSDGGVITAHHLRRDRDYETVVATVEAHPASPGRVVLRTAGTWAWAIRPDGESVKTVDPGRRLAVRTMTIDFGSVRGRILGS